MRAAGPEPLVGSWNSPPRKSAKEKKIITQRRGSRTTEVSLHGPAPPSAFTCPSYPQSTGKDSQTPKDSLEREWQKPKATWRKQTIPEKKTTWQKSILPTRNTRASRLKEQERSQKKVPNEYSTKSNSTLSGENVSQQSRRSRRWNIEIKRKTLQCQAESPTATQSQVKRITETEDRTWEETSPKLKTMSGGHPTYPAL